ncbi:MAG: hypothetical protein M1820_009493 [Bogoriella megaspora]|nr:MAG: hypothetical protein M1820_009493 [Bogoriella megaspora]
MAKNRDLLQQLCDLQIPDTIRISPDSQRLIYSTRLSWGHYKGKLPVSTLWIANSGQAKSAKALTRGQFNDSSPAWHPDGTSIAFISDRGGPGESQAIHGMSLNTWNSEAEPSSYPITDVGNKQRITAFQFSPDGSEIAYISADEKTKERKVREKEGRDQKVWGEDWEYARLRVVNIQTKQVRSLSLERHVFEICWSWDGQQIALLSSRSPDMEEQLLYGSWISTVDRDLNFKGDICHVPKYIHDLAWDRERKLYFIAGLPLDQIFGGQAVYVISPHQSQQYSKLAFGSEDGTVGLNRNSSGAVYAKVEHGFESRICEASGKVVYAIEQEIEAFDVAYKADGKALVAFATSDTDNPVEVFTSTDSVSVKTQISDHGHPIQGQHFGTRTFFSCQSVDDETDVTAIYIKPKTASGTPGAPLPTVVLIHGGPNTRLTDAFNTYYFMWSPYLLSLGYGILIPNYRGGSGRGEKFSSYCINGTGKHDYSDIITITQCAIDRGFADKERLVVGGWSHGGFLAGLCSVRNGTHGHGWRFKAAVAGAGIYDSDAMALTSDLGCTFQPELHAGRVAWTMDQDDSRNRMASPLWQFKNAVQSGVDFPPMLILHGEEDARCPVSQARGLRRALRHYSLPFELVLYPRQGHIFSEQNFWIDIAIRVGEWCDKYIGEGLASEGASIGA